MAKASTIGIIAATRSYERWAAARTRLLPADLRDKHRQMTERPFPFLRATFYRWAALFPELCPALAEAPRVLAIADLHIESFGTWRDAEARLVWGVNDVDEAFRLPYTNDLVRLAASALLAIATQPDDLRIDPALACATILDGYRKRIDEGAAKPFLLEEEHSALRQMALGAERAPAKFWEKLAAHRGVAAPKSVVKLLRRQLPEGAELVRIVHRAVGLGSLGHERYLALATRAGGWVAREAKPVLASACVWAAGDADDRSYSEKLAARAALASDPFLRFKDGWMVRRVAPDCSTIALEDVPKERDEPRILEAMGAETANIHLRDRDGAAVAGDLARRAKHDADWLEKGARRMARAVMTDWKEWRGARSR